MIGNQRNGGRRQYGFAEPDDKTGAKQRGEIRSQVAATWAKRPQQDTAEQQPGAREAIDGKG